MAACRQGQALLLIAVLLIGNGDSAPLPERAARQVAAAADSHVEILQNIRTGMDVAREIAITKLASDIELAGEEAAALGESCSRVRFALSLTCDIYGASESIRQLPQGNGTVAALQVVTSAILRDACEWTNVIYSEDFPTSDYQLNCTTAAEIANVCSHFETLTFTEQSSTTFSDYLNNAWMEEHDIDRAV